MSGKSAREFVAIVRSSSTTSFKDSILILVNTEIISRCRGTSKQNLFLSQNLLFFLQPPQRLFMGNYFLHSGRNNISEWLYNDSLEIKYAVKVPYYDIL